MASPNALYDESLFATQRPVPRTTTELLCTLLHALPPAPPPTSPQARAEQHRALAEQLKHTATLSADEVAHIRGLLTDIERKNRQAFGLTNGIDSQARIPWRHVGNGTKVGALKGKAWKMGTSGLNLRWLAGRPGEPIDCIKEKAWLYAKMAGTPDGMGPSLQAPLSGT